MTGTHPAYLQLTPARHTGSTAGPLCCSQLRVMLRGYQRRVTQRGNTRGQSSVGTNTYLMSSSRGSRWVQPRGGCCRHTYAYTQGFTLTGVPRGTECCVSLLLIVRVFNSPSLSQGSTQGSSQGGHRGAPGFPLSLLLIVRVFNSEGPTVWAGTTSGSQGTNPWYFRPHLGRY